MTSALDLEPSNEPFIGSAISSELKRADRDRLETGGNYYFEVRRDEEVSVTSILFCGGAWRWHLCAADGRVVATGEGHSTEPACREALAAIRAMPAVHWNPNNKGASEWRRVSARATRKSGNPRSRARQRPTLQIRR